MDLIREFNETLVVEFWLQYRLDWRVLLWSVQRVGLVDWSYHLRGTE
jgi:hypothetical protein